MTEPSMPTAMRPSTLSFDEFLTNNTSHKYLSDTPNPTIMNPRTAARSHSKLIIATLHTTMQPKLLKLADMFHDAFIKLYNYEEQLEKFQNNSDYIPASARINLSHKDHYHEDIRGGSETKSLDEETSAIVRDCQRDLARQIRKATQLNQAAQKMTLLKILSDFLLHSATGFLTLYNVSKIDKNYSAHQAISDMSVLGKEYCTAFLLTLRLRNSSRHTTPALSTTFLYPPRSISVPSSITRSNTTLIPT